MLGAGAVLPNFYSPLFIGQGFRWGSYPLHDSSLVKMSIVCIYGADTAEAWGE